MRTPFPISIVARFRSVSRRSRRLRRPRRGPAASALAAVATLGGMLAAATGASAAGVPITPGTMELQAGIAAIILPESVDGTFSAQPEVRFGYFLREAVELQVIGDVRVWPLGAKAPHSYGIGGVLLWFPRVHEDRNFYLLAGAGGAYTDPPGTEGSSFDPLGRAGFGFKVPMEGFGFLPSAFMTIEYRAELSFADETDFVSGAALGISMFR